MDYNTSAFLGSILLSAVVLSPVACQVNRDNVRTEALAKSSDPIALSCAMDSTDANGNSKAICTLRASGR